MSAAVQAVRELLHVPNDYHVLYLHGGAHAVFAALPLNLAGDKSSADYVSSRDLVREGRSVVRGARGGICVHVPML